MRDRRDGVDHEFTNALDLFLHLEPTNFVRKVEVLMGPLKMFAIATNRTQPSGPCAKLIQDAETECGAFMSATNQLFGKEVARTAVALWVEELEADPEHFRGRDSGWRIVTISAASRLADLMGAIRSTEKTYYGGDERQHLCKDQVKNLHDVRPSKFSHRQERSA